MELIERYLHEVGRHLPPKSRDDILAELRSLLLDQLEERNPEGQPTEADVVAVLREMGAPKKVAASYAGDRYLIGPALYPTFIQVMKIVAGVLLVLPALGILGGFTNEFASFDHAFNAGIDIFASYFNALLSAFGMVAFVFAMLEWWEVRVPATEETWHPRTLPAVTRAGKVSLFDSALGIAFNVVAFTTLTYFYQRGGIPLDIAPDGVLVISGWVMIALLVLILLEILIYLYVIQVGAWRITTRLIGAGLDLICAFLVYTGILQIVVQLATILPREDFPFPPGYITSNIGIGFGIAVVIIVVDNVVKIYKLLTEPNTSPAPVIKPTISASRG